MKRMKRMTGLLGCALLLFSIAATPGFAAEAKIGYVNLQKALNLSKAGESAKETISEKVKEYEGIIESRQQELGELKSELEKKAMLLSEEARAEKERDYQQKLKEFQRFTKDVQEELQQRDADLTRRILEDLFEVIQKVGKEEGYTLVLEKTESSVLYADDSVNLTQKVIDAYNARYEKTQGN